MERPFLLSGSRVPGVSALQRAPRAAGPVLLSASLKPLSRD